MKYNNYSKEQLIDKLNKLEKNKYGLVWENKPEAIADKCEKELPILIEDKNREIISDSAKPTHFIFEGDNYHALYTMNFTHQKKIDVIYIDPPYNTGKKDFKYNDKFIDGEDRFRHSKWLSFMSKRLKLAKKLLSDDGVIFISIDDNEQANLKLLCDKIFGEQNFIETIMVEMSNTGGMKVASAKKGTITKNGEFILLYSKSKESYKKVKRTPLFDFVPGFDKHFNLYMNKDKSVSKLSDVLVEDKDIISEFKRLDIKISLNKFSEYFDKSAVFQKFAINNVKKIVRSRNEIPIIPKSIHIKKDTYIKYKSTNRGEIYFLTLNSDSNVVQLVPMSLNYRHTDDFISTYGRSVIRGDFWKGFWVDMGNISKEGNVVFTNGKKPTRLIQQLLKWAVFKNKNAIVMDFFAGSATTAHAVLELNKQDGGNRQFIACTNNEVGFKSENDFCKKYDITAKELKKWKDENRLEWVNWCEQYGICSTITYPRIKNVINGYANIGGIPANVKYFKTDFVPAVLTDNDKRVLVEKSTELLCMAENTFNIVRQKNKLDYSVFSKFDKYTAIIYDEEYIDRCCNKLNQMQPKNKTTIYVFSYDHTYNKEDFINLNIDFIVKPIPEAIINVYRKISKLKNK